MAGDRPPQGHPERSVSPQTASTHVRSRVGMGGAVPYQRQEHRRAKGTHRRRATQPLRRHQGPDRARFLARGRNRLPVSPSAGVGSPLPEWQWPPCPTHHRPVAEKDSAAAALYVGRHARHTGRRYQGGVSGCLARRGPG